MSLSVACCQVYNVNDMYGPEADFPVHININMAKVMGVFLAQLRSVLFKVFKVFFLFLFFFLCFSQLSNIPLCFCLSFSQAVIGRPEDTASPWFRSAEPRQCRIGRLGAGPAAVESQRRERGHCYDHHHLAGSAPRPDQQHRH